ncbi:831_t:CDS:10 [Cetraspora pellucida]|uniref:831_t:CDS:1 n=1 Tax=Cetraspora pellucida TaxID=1433469 RepID=A0ACA9MLA6_9GLOM|nr:831_t:CDS:10 [Cetraspora pellucida]
MTVRIQFRIDDIGIDNTDNKKVIITLGASTGLGGNAKFQTEGTGAPLTADSRIAAGGIDTIEVNCSTELEARKVIGLLGLKDSQNNPKSWLNITGTHDDNLILKPTSFADGKVLENLHIDNVVMTDNDEVTSTTPELEQHYTKDGGDLASRNLDSDLAALEKYSNAVANTNEQVVYGVDDVLRANANQFIIALRHGATGAGGGIGNANLIWEDGVNDETHGEISKIFDETNGIKKNPAGVPTYKGFPIFEAKQKVGKDNTNNNQSKNRREFGEDADGNNGKNAAASSIFTKTKIDNFRLTTEFDGESDPQNCRGFQPGDLTTANIFRLGINAIDISATGGNTFQYPVKQADGTWGVSTDHYEENEATKLCFMIVRLLEKYYIAVKANTTANYANNEVGRKGIDFAYNFLLQVAQLVDENPTDQATSKLLELKQQKKPTQTPSPTGKKPDDAKIDAARDEIVGATTGGDDMKALLKKIFDDNRAELKKNDEAVLTNLKELAKIIDRAYKNGDEVRPSKLRAYSGGDVNQKKAWELTNKVVDKDNKKLADEALNKAKKPEKTLDEIKQEAKGKMGDDKAETLVNKVVEIFGKCKSAWAKNKGTDDNLGYAAGALAKLKKATTDLTTLITESKIDQVTDQASLDKALGIIKGSANYNNIKTDVEQLVEPRAKLLVELNKDSNTDKKALAKLIAEFIKKFEKNYVDSNYATDLSTLESKLTELRKYSETGDKNTVYNNLSAEGKATLNNLISGLDAKVKAMQAAKKASEQSQNPDGG